MKQCNRCRNKRCDRIRMHHAKKRILSTEEMRKECSYHMPLIPYREKLLLLSLDTNPQAVHDVLYKFGFMIQELAEYPYFKIILDKKKEVPKV